MMARLFVLLFFCLAGSAYAETAANAQKQLSGTLSELQAAHHKQKMLEEKQNQLEREMKALQQQTVEIARNAQEQEDSLSALEEKNDILEGQKKTILSSLEERKAQLSAIISAMVKLGKLPPESVIAMPGKLNETLSAARALGVITKAVEEEASSLKAQLHELDELEQKIARNRDALVHKKDDVATRQKALADKIRERSKLQTELGGEAKEQKARMAQLTEKSKTLQELVDTLGRSEHGAAEEPPASTARSKLSNLFGTSHKARSFAQAKGKLTLPAVGKVVGLYGHSEGGDAFSKGLVMETRQGTGVVAPYDGEVVYAGVFRDYGKMVIIRHNGDYHTLLSGMEEMSCAPGQSVLEGEPIGIMGKGADGTKPRLYIEMRKSGKPIDPMSWFK